MIREAKQEDLMEILNFIITKKIGMRLCCLQGQRRKETNSYGG